MNSVSMISMRLDSSNVEHVKYLTTEGLDKQQRLKFLRGIKDELDADLFELSIATVFMSAALLAMT